MCEAEEWDDATDHLATLIRLQWVTEDEARLWRGRIALGQHEFAEAKRLLAKAANDDRRAWPYLAVACARLGDDNEAFGHARRAVEARLPGAWVALGDVHAEQKDHEAALACYEREMGGLLDQGRAYRLAAESLLRLGDPREAAAMCRMAIRKRPWLEPSDLGMLVDLLRRSGRVNDAEKWSRCAVDCSRGTEHAD